MSNKQLEKIKTRKEDADVCIYTLGQFLTYRNEVAIKEKEWGREKTIQLFQFLVTARNRNRLHKEQIIARIWEDAAGDQGNRDFKVAMHGINKALEPDRKSRSEPKYISRQGLTYQLNKENVWIDIEAMNEYISLGNDLIVDDEEVAQKAYKEALSLYEGIYLPDRVYEDWTSSERERTQVLVLNTYIALADLLVSQNPLESIRLTQEALLIDKTLEEAYRIQMQAYANKGNRPMALKTFQKCEKILDKEFGIAPLPETRLLENQIREIV